MNALTPITAGNAVAVSDDQLINILQNSLYPGAKAESVALVLSYCQVNGIDPMLKAVHIVPVWDKSIGGMRDVLMPGIADYRIKASRSGEYAGKSEPEFGPDVTENLDGVKVTYPQWCRVTVSRIVDGAARQFTAKERWLENYATAKRDTAAPNTMWRKRPYGQLGKCTEAQSLRMAFPEFSGGNPTAEEMEGKSFAGVTLDAEPEAHPARVSTGQPGTLREYAENVTAPKPAVVPPTPMEWFTARIAKMNTAAETYNLLAEGTKARGLFDTRPEDEQTAIKAMLAERAGSFYPEPEPDVVEGDVLQPEGV